MKRNPFDAFIKGETAIHIQVAEYLQYQYPNVMFHHSPNEARRTPFERYLISKMGVSAGFPDFVIYGMKYTIALELKYKNNTPTEAQLKWLQHFNRQSNCISFVAWSFESARYMIDHYFNINKEISLCDYGRLDGSLFIEYVFDYEDCLPAKIKKQLDL